MSNFNDDENELDQDSFDEIEDENDYVDNSVQRNYQDTSKSKNPIKNFIRNPIGTISDGFKSLFGKKKKKVKFKEIWKKIPLKFKIAIVAGGASIVIIVILILAIGDIASKIAVSDRSDGINKLNISESSPESSKLALELYNKYDSLIGFTTEQLNVIFETFKEDDSTGNRYLLTSASKKFGQNGGEKFSPDEERTLYEHIQRTEKYNFNKIKWKSFTHSDDNVDIELEERGDLELFVPKGIDEDTLCTLLKTTAPYLLTQDIPLGILSGMVGYSGGTSSRDATTAENFTYQIIKEALTKMTVNKYELETLKLQSSYDDCNYNTYAYQYTVRTYKNGYKEIVSETEPQLQESRNEKTPEVKINGTEQYTYETFWYVAEAITYDRIINNSFDHQKYSSSDVDNLANADSNNLVNTIEINELYEEIEPVISIDNGDTKKPEDTSTYEDKTYTHKYVRKEGVTYVYEKEWKDKLTVNQSSSEVYNYNTAKDFNTKNNEDYSNMKTNKSIIDESKFLEDNPEGNNLFETLMKEDVRTNLNGMSIIDLMNSNSGIYNQYIRKNSAYAEYQAISRGNLRPAYNQVKNIINLLVKRDTSAESSEEPNGEGQFSINSYTTGHAVDGAVPFVYGSSLGYEVTDISMQSSTNFNYVSGMDLLKQYIRSFEGYGEQPIQTNADGVECYVAYRDSGENLTVGYGVNLDGNPADKTDLEEKIGQTIDVGTLVPVELVDAIEEQKIKSFYDTVKAKTNGLDLKEYQIHALTSLEYNNIKVDKIVDYYRDSAYWNEETDDKYEEVYEKYKDNETAVSQIEAEADMTRGLYTDWLALNIHDNKGNELPGLIRRRRSEYILFSLGYYNTLQKFWNAGGTPGDINLYNADGTVNEGACIELQNWFDQNIFSGHMGLEQTVSWKSRDFSRYDSKWVSYVTHDLFKQTGSQGGSPVGISGFIYQCPWWALSRAHLYLYGKDPEKWKNGLGGGHGHGMEVAQRVANQYYLPCESNWDDLRPNSIISFNTGNGVGHVAYVEAVDKKNGYYYVSHAGSGKHFYGITKHKIGEGAGVNAISMQFVCLEGL